MSEKPENTMRENAEFKIMKRSFNKVFRILTQLSADKEIDKLDECGIDWKFEITSTADHYLRILNEVPNLEHYYIDKRKFEIDPLVVNRYDAKNVRAMKNAFNKWIPLAEKIELSGRKLHVINIT